MGLLEKVCYTDKYTDKIERRHCYARFLYYRFTLPFHRIDGTYAPKEVAALAAKIGLSAIGLDRP